MMPDVAIPTAGEPLIRIRGLVKHFPISRSLLSSRPTGMVRAVDGIDLDIGNGETLGLVGESGSGKTTASRLLIRLIEATAGEIAFEGADVRSLSSAALRAFRRKVQVVFQDPFGSLDPRMTVARIIAEPLVIAGGMTAKERRARVDELLELVGLPHELADRYPHQFSGGQRQRIGIARALAPRPRFLICDEPVSALDLSIQAQIINLLLKLKRELGLTMLFVAHDLQVIRYVSDRVGVMYLGRLVELAPAAEIFERSRHPYTRLLLESAPRLRRTASEESDAQPGITGEVPNPIDLPSGCRFHPRCPMATSRCAVEDPAWRELGAGHHVACHHAEQVPQFTATA